MISLREITVRFGTAEALRRVNLTVAQGCRLGVVGESGSGKTMVGLCMMGMLPDKAALQGSVKFDEKELSGASDADWRRLRAKRVAMVFQEPMSALNPLRRVGQTVAEPLRLRMGYSQKEAKTRVIELFEETGLPDPSEKARLFPHQLSGGQRQRVLIALALSCDPDILIADEPTSALDAHVGLRITNLLVHLCKARNMGLLFISHDITAVARTVTDVAVMYGGEVVEQGPVHQVLAAPQHPYTKGLLAAQPTISHLPTRERLPVIPGTVPPLDLLPKGCRFSGRCAQELGICAMQSPKTKQVARDHFVGCHNMEEGR